MSDLPPQVIIGLLVLVVVVIRRLRPTVLTAPRLLVGPLVVLVLGAAGVGVILAAGPVPSAVDAAAGAVDLLLSGVLGVLRAFTVQIEHGAGSTQYRYTQATVALWAASVAVRFVLGGLGHQLGAAPVVTSGSVLAMLGLTLLVQNMVVLCRGGQRPARPAPQRIPATAATASPTDSAADARSADETSVPTVNRTEV